MKVATPMRGGHRTPSGAIVYCNPRLARRRFDLLGWLLRLLGFREWPAHPPRPRPAPKPRPLCGYQPPPRQAAAPSPVPPPRRK